jgi:hypothetical protein
MTGKEIVRQARNASKDFQLTSGKSRKFSGAMTAELMKSALENEGIPTSARDVFIRGLPSEIDLIVPYPGEKPTLGLLYEPRQVALALEIKKTGSFGGQGLQTIRELFGQLRRLKVACTYVSLEDRKNYRHRPTYKNLGRYKCYTLAWHDDADGPFKDTRHWEGHLTFIRKRTSVRHR